MKNLNCLWLIAILSTVLFSACTDDCDNYPDEALINPEIYNWFPSANTFPSIFNSNLGNVRSVTYSTTQGQRDYEDCSSKTYEWIQFEIDLDDTDRIRMNANNSNFTIAALLGETDSFTYSGQLFLNGTIFYNGQSVDSLTINGNNYADVFLVTSNDATNVLDSIVLQNNTEFVSFKYKDEIWTND